VVGACTGFSGGIPTALDITATPTADAAAAACSSAAAASAATAADDDPHANCNTIEAEEKNTFGLGSNKTCQTAFLNIIRPKF
jgi:hypothetical protein